jgi:hypothetical protein
MIAYDHLFIHSILRFKLKTISLGSFATDERGNRMNAATDSQGSPSAMTASGIAFPREKAKARRQGLGHVAMFDDPELVTAAIRRAVSRLRPSPWPPTGGA